VAHALAEHTGEGCSVEILSWDKYKEAMLDTKNDSWRILWNADIVIGGLELDGDFM
jgi:hypothetical protein